MQTFDEFMDAYAAMYLRDVMRECNGVVSHAAKIAGRNRTDFYKVLRRYNIPYRMVKKRGKWERPIPEDW